MFGWLAKSGGVAEKEMLRTFNCGTGMVIVVSADAVDAVVDVLTKAGETVSRIGTIEAEGAAPVLFDGSLDLGA